MSDQPKGPVYNNKRFKPNDYNFDMFIGPRAGEKFIDHTFTELGTGKEVKLSDFEGQWTVLETGSSTCSMYTKNIPTMKDIAGEYPDVTFVLIYVREAHPGERLGPHETMEEKMAAAKLVAPRYGEHRRVLVDNLAGDFHRGYGAMPNVLYVIRPDGTIHYRCNWATPEKVREVLNDRETYHTHENADLFELRASRAKMHMIRTMWTGGILALYDFVKGAPFVVSKHVKTDAYYKKHGKFKNQSDDVSEAPMPGTPAAAKSAAAQEASPQPGE